MTLDTMMTRHVVSVRMDDELHVIRDLFNKYRFHHLLVMDRCRVVGVISDRDLLKNTSPFLGKAAERTMDVQCLHRKAHQIMNRSLISGAPEMPIADAALLMINNRISCLPVLNADGACVGIVTMRDLLRWALKQMADQACVNELRAETQARKAA
ncbi:MAG TPA: CBS domain-containing protein [Phycisphaerales bacterium]|nr:CBS domain-containing protein [Phycisphaerales bacterium]